MTFAGRRECGKEPEAQNKEESHTGLHQAKDHWVAHSPTTSQFCLRVVGGVGLSPTPLTEMTNKTSTRKVSLRSVCNNDDTLAAIRFVVEHVATPLRVRLLDFLRHFLVAMCDPDWRCEVCQQRWRRESGLDAPPQRECLAKSTLL